MTTRINCCVPYCRRTRGDRKGEPPITEDMEWVCGPHWQATSKVWRRRRSLFKRRGRLDLDHKMWQRLKKQAIERAVGL